MRDADDYAKSHPRMRSLYLRAMYPIWHRDETRPLPEIANLEAAMPPGRGPGYVCADCQRAFAEVPRWTATISTATGGFTFARCATCAARANYRENR